MNSQIILNYIREYTTNHTNYDKNVIDIISFYMDEIEKGKNEENMIIIRIIDDDNNLNLTRTEKIIYFIFLLFIISIIVLIIWTIIKGIMNNNFWDVYLY